MADNGTVVKVRNEIPSLVGPLWFGGWLFTIGYLHLHLVQALFALVIWPYYIGNTFAR